jgi:hypothetical protein
MPPRSRARSRRRNEYRASGDGGRGRGGRALVGEFGGRSFALGSSMSRISSANRASPHVGATGPGKARLRRVVQAFAPSDGTRRAWTALRASASTLSHRGFGSPLRTGCTSTASVWARHGRQAGLAVASGREETDDSKFLPAAWLVGLAARNNCPQRSRHDALAGSAPPRSAAADATLGDGPRCVYLDRIAAGQKLISRRLRNSRRGLPGEAQMTRSIDQNCNQDLSNARSEATSMPG